jgi:hypothetical protein
MVSTARFLEGIVAAFFTILDGNSGVSLSEINHGQWN